MKKIITLILTLVLAICLFGSIGCGEKDKTNPSLTDGDAVFATVNEKVNGTELTYSVSKNEIYGYLKSQYGSSALINILDKYLLENINNKDGKSFYSAVTEEEIKEEIKLNCYGTEEEAAKLTEEEKAEKEKDFIDTMFISYGCLETDIFGASIVEQYRLSLAQKACALTKLAEEIASHNAKYEEYKKMSKEEVAKYNEEYEAMTDEEKAEKGALVTTPYYTDDAVSKKYVEDNYNTYNAIVVPFTSERQAEIALSQIGVKAEDGVWKDNDTALTAVEVYNKFIELYQNFYGYKELGTLNKDSEEFTLKEADLNTNVLAYIKDNMAVYDNDSQNTNSPKWYTAKAYATSSGSLFVYVLCLGKNEVKAYADLTKAEKASQLEEYLPALMKDTNTNTYALTKMAELRETKNVIIYDSVVENGYVSGLKSLSVTHKNTEEESTTLVAKIDGKEVTTNNLFDYLIKFQGANAATEKLAEKRALYNPTLNKYYDMSSKKWLDSDKEKEISESIKSEKTNFENGSYKDYGYDPASISWELFYKTLYNVQNEEQLTLSFLAESITSEYTTNINYIVNTVKDSAGKKSYTMTLEDAKASDLWKMINDAMTKKTAESFKVKGIHLLICQYANINDYISATNPVDPKDWTDAQKAGANELYAQVIAYLAATKGTYESRLTDIVNAFKAAPFANIPAKFNGSDVTLTFGDTAVIEVSKFKALGLSVKYESLSTFSNGSMVEEFDAKVKEIWDADAAKDVFNNSDLKELDKITVADEVIETKFGYHVYINLQSLELSYAHKNTVTSTDSTKKYEYVYVPTLEEVRDYVLNGTESTVGTNVKTAITTFYTPIANELSGEYFTYIMRYNAINSLLGSYKSDLVSSANVEKYINLYTDYTFETYLSKVTPEYLYVK